ncbi:MAG: diguanylate cyclase [Chloroflexi bacterium]|nr:diguanylate cyclase [Chloroflexota bacterium]
MSKARILIVEDEQIVALDIQSTLESCGYIIAGQTNRGDDAVKKAGELGPDLVMIDIGLKGETDGVEAATQIRERFHIPVIFLTAFSDQSTTDRARLAEPYGYLLKPFEERELVIAAEMALYKHGMEKKLRESENKFRSVIEQASDGIALTDSQGMIIEWNSTMEQITGLNRAKVIGQAVWETVYQIVPREKRAPGLQETIENQWKVEAGNSNVDKDQMTEYEIEDLQGLHRIVQSNGFSIETTQGTLGGVIMRDVTQRRQTELEILATKHQLEATLNAVPDLLFEIGLDGRYYNYHSPLVSLLAAPPESFLGKTVFEILPPEAASVAMDALREAHEKGFSHGRQYELQLSQGRFWFELSISRKNANPEEEPRFIALSRDITDRKLLELAERDQRQLAEALRDTAMALNGTLKLDDVLDRILANIGKLVNYDTAMVSLIEGDSVRKIRYYNNPRENTSPRSIGDTQANLLNIPILKEIIKTKQAYLIPDIQADKRWKIVAIPGAQRVHSLICAPIEIQGNVAGIVNVISATPNFFTPVHTERIMAFASQAAVAMENAQLFERAKRLSLTDPLTELFNMRYFLDFANLEFERVRRYARTLSVAMVDIDHFKNINDTHGHSIGDLVLREVADRIKRSVRAVDVVARYGGEEFVVLMPETGLEEACQVAERVRQIAADSPIEIKDIAISLTLSLGVAEINKTDSLNELIKHADRALYKAKDNGRNRMESYLFHR